MSDIIERWRTWVDVHQKQIGRLEADNERLREVLAVIASGGTKYDSAADLIRIAARALEPKP